MALLLRLLQEHFASGDEARITIDGLWLRLEGGSLYVDGDDPRVHDLVAPEADTDRVLRELADSFAGRQAAASADGDSPANIAGPFPAAPLLGSLALFGVRPETLELRLGGVDQRLAITVPAVDIGPLSADALRLVDRLQACPTLGQLLLEHGDSGRDDLLSTLAVMRAYGVVVSAEQPSSEAGRSLTVRLKKRIAERLELEPVEQDRGAHRELIADLFGRLGELDHYALLEVERGCDDAAITAGFDRVARRVHPSHAGRLGLAHDDAILESLFDRSVEAFHTLIDADRRIAYNRDLAAKTAPHSVDAEQRQKEKKSIADESVRQALTELRDQDVSSAVERLKEAARLAPSADTFALLARAQTRNPAWRRHAMYSWREALALREDWPEAHVALAELLESMGEMAQAIEHYQKSLALDPGNGNVQAALSRLGAKAAPAGNRRLPWRKS